MWALVFDPEFTVSILIAYPISTIPELKHCCIPVAQMMLQTILQCCITAAWTCSSNPASYLNIYDI